MLVVRGRKAISSTSVYKVSKVEEGTPSSEEEFGQARNLMAEATRKEMVIRAASKRAGGRTIIGIFERYRKLLVEKGGRKRRWNEEAIKKERSNWATPSL